MVWFAVIATTVSPSLTRSTVAMRVRGLAAWAERGRRNSRAAIVDRQARRAFMGKSRRSKRSWLYFVSRSTLQLTGARQPGCVQRLVRPSVAF